MAHVEAGDWATVLPGRSPSSSPPGGRCGSIPIRAIRPPHAVGLIAPYREPHTPVLDALLQMSRALADELDR